MVKYKNIQEVEALGDKHEHYKLIWKLCSAYDMSFRLALVEASYQVYSSVEEDQTEEENRLKKDIAKLKRKVVKQTEKLKLLASDIAEDKFLEGIIKYSIGKAMKAG